MRKQILSHLTQKQKASASSSSSTGEREDHKQCHVCLTEYESGEQLRILPCFHRFHSGTLPWGYLSVAVCTVVCHSSFCVVYKLWQVEQYSSLHPNRKKWKRALRSPTDWLTRALHLVSISYTILLWFHCSVHWRMDKDESDVSSLSRPCRVRRLTHRNFNLKEKEKSPGPAFLSVQDVFHYAHTICNSSCDFAVLIHSTNFTHFAKKIWLSRRSDSSGKTIAFGT